jgi:putative Mg2+ transporter-C (MgtC) family protein
MIDVPYQADIILRLLVAVIAGGVVGWNREREDKPAGLRTHMLVSLGSASFTVIMIDLMQRYPAHTGGGDPTRIVQGIATGIGFLGAGSIMQSGRTVRGITTAAGIWVVGAIGVACGAGAYVIAGTTVLLTFIILSAVVRLERRIQPARPQMPPDSSAQGGLGSA